jgi:hypothetical protein
MVSLLGEGEMTHLLKQMWLERPVRFSEDRIPLKKMIEIFSQRRRARREEFEMLRIEKQMPRR